MTAFALRTVKSTEVHRCANPGKSATRVLWVITPPHY